MNNAKKKAKKNVISININLEEPELTRFNPQIYLGDKPRLDKCLKKYDLRFKDFLNHDTQLKAAATIKKKKVKAIIAIGGNGTFRGLDELCSLIPTSIQVFFIPVTIDSDVAGTDCIGQHTGVEVGAEKIRCYMADARTHKRVYIVEMMGANSGYHALHSCLGSRAHLAVLPNSNIDHKRVIDADWN